MESLFVWGHLSTFVELELAFEATIVSLRFFDDAKRNKAAERTKKIKHEDRLTHWVSHQTAMVSPNVPVCQTLKEKIKLAIERSNQRVAERFRDAVPYRPKL
ncbi:hypothetical protein H5410_050448 [Solanum commersonii]|uniref:Uncharacterized protein n=1 Tax=Solanum commersonii TaxID=4109 RepID=A0A9J5WX37_SOLCO|nr:hypothetical protein H5410_050448 [Solanum commersonii]